MKPAELLDILRVAERLKCNTRHCVTSTGRPESVAEHSWRIALMAMLLKEEFAGADMDKVIKMCLIHDLGEAFTGDVPAFNKTAAHEAEEEARLSAWVEALPGDVRGTFRALYAEMNAMETEEAKIYKALDKIEAVIQHNESDINTWLPLEYDLQFTYADSNTSFHPYLKALDREVDAWTKRKIEEKALQNGEE
ncbi:MAG: HD domain-containing protein [Clostridia bacterium]|nr:HD domain-containing protein [Clostridia bacterium]